jgi:hypothetical protein
MALNADMTSRTERVIEARKRLDRKARVYADLRRENERRARAARVIAETRDDAIARAKRAF